MRTQIKTAQEIVDMRESGRILATILAELKVFTKVGITTTDIDREAARLLDQHKATAAFLNYNGFPASICISINNEIAHGIPDDRVLEDGDLVHLDFGVTYHGMITDAGFGFVLGKATEDQQRLLTGTKQALDAAIAEVKDGVRLGDIGQAVEDVCERYNLKLVYELCGHGVGHQVHEEPTIMNYGLRGTGEALKAGMTIALEPNVALGSHEMYLADNGWTWMTKDGSQAVQFEHTVLITDDGAEILTSIE